MLLSVNAWQPAGARRQQGTIARDEFKKHVYESKLTKRAEGMSFTNSKSAASTPEKCHAGRAAEGSPIPSLFRGVSEKTDYVKGQNPETREKKDYPPLSPESSLP